MLSEGDVVLGRLVIERGLATPQQVKQAAGDIARALEKRKTPRGLGEILVEKGFLEHEHLFTLADLVGQSEGNALVLSRMALEDSLLSRLVAARNLVDVELLRTAFNERNVAEREGDFITLGNLLLKKRAINPKQYSELRTHVRSWVRACKSCGMLSAVDPKKGIASCPQCDQVLPRSVTVGGSLRLPSGKDRRAAAGTPDSGRVDAQVMLRGLTIDEGAKDTETIGPYEIIGCVGKGNMGIVYHARHTDTGQEVALKVLTDATDATAAQRFEWEAKSVGKLEHPNIIQVYGTGVHQQTGRPYIAMELIDGQSLEAAIRAEDVDLVTAVRVMAQSARAVQAAHEAGIVHRDLKPANILLTTSNDAKLGDFGIARDEERDVQLTIDGTAMGTPHYMSPEQLGGKKEQIGKHSDVYSLGAMLYEAVVGHVPFNGATSPADLFHRIITEAPLPPSRKNKDVPPEIDELCMKSLSKLADERPPSAAFVAETLETVLERLGGGGNGQGKAAGFKDAAEDDDGARSSRRRNVPTDLRRYAADPDELDSGELKKRVGPIKDDDTHKDLQVIDTERSADATAKEPAQSESGGRPRPAIGGESGSLKDTEPNRPIASAAAFEATQEMDFSEARRQGKVPARPGGDGGGGDGEDGGLPMGVLIGVGAVVALLVIGGIILIAIGLASG